MANEVYRARQAVKAQAAKTGQSYEDLSKEYAQIRSSQGGQALSSSQIANLGTGKNSGTSQSASAADQGFSLVGGSTSDANGISSTPTSQQILDLGKGPLSQKGYDRAVSSAAGKDGGLLLVRADEAPMQSAKTTPTPVQPTGNDPYVTGRDDYGDEDLSVQLRRAIDGEVPPAVVQDILDRRIQKAKEKGYFQYLMDDIEVEARAYIAGKSGQSGGTSSANYDLSGHLEDEAAGRLESALADLKRAYGKTMDEYDATQDKLPQYYQEAKNRAAAQSAMAKKNFAEQAGASGLNSGASGQAALDASATYQGTLAQLDESQASALAELDRAKADLTAQYQTAVAKAQAEGKADLAQALYQEMVRVQGLQRADDAMSYNRYLTELERQRLAEQTSYDRQRAAQQEAYNKQLNQANIMAQYGDFTGYAKLFDLPVSVVEAMAKEYAKQQQLSEAEAARALTEWFAKWGDFSKLRELNVDTSYLTGG